MEKYIDQMRYVVYDTEFKKTHNDKKGSVYSNDILTFDIETTSAWIKDDEIIGYEKGHSNEYWNELQPLALCYLWQFSFNQKVYYGRELRDFEQVLKDIPKNLKVVIWVHNLAYEFHFLNNFLEWESVFAKTPHKPMKCIPKKYPNIEFRCSYMLTRLSLESWGKQIGHHKDVGYLDYEAIRTPLTPLTEKELKYGEDDCLVVYYGIKIYKERYGNIRDIPLTQTGTVRKIVKESLTRDKKYVRFIKRLIPKTPEEYKRLMYLFSGGYTHANRFYSGMVINGYIEHYDFTSSYPSVMISEKYPMNPWTYSLDKEFPTDEEMERNAYIMKITFKNIKCITMNTYLQTSKCTGFNMKYDNGRIIKAQELTTIVTEMDWQTIKESYVWDKAEIIYKYYSIKKYLPKKFIDYILELYHNKTALKDIEEMEDLYMQSKQYINSLFGMCVTAIVQPDVIFDGKEWTILPLDSEFVKNRLDTLRDWRSREKRYFVSYSWGCWITSYARRNLWKCILDCDKECIYCDTDSIFVRGKHDFSWYNEEITNKIKKASEEVGFDFEKTRPKTKYGVEKPLGLFLPEEPCSQFITLGAKRYVERRIKDGKLHLTVSGINKEAVSLLKDDISNFKDGFDFDKDDDSVNKKLLTYITDMPNVVFDDGYVSTYKEGINMRRTGYLLTITDEYKILVRLSQLTPYDLDEREQLRIRASFTSSTSGTLEEEI